MAAEECCQAAVVIADRIPLQSIICAAAIIEQFSFHDAIDMNTRSITGTQTPWAY
jgi:hypothetical protein